MRLLLSILFIINYCFSDDVINYQGILFDDSTNEIIEDGNYNLTFKLYQNYDDASSIWQESVTLNVEDGFYSHNLGSITSLDNIDFSNQYWLGISLDNNEFGRYMLTSTPHSMHSNNSSKIEGYDVEDLKNRIIISDYIEIGLQNFTPGQWVNFENLYLNIEYDMTIHVSGTFSHAGTGPDGYQFTLYDGNGQFLDDLSNSFTNPPGAQKWVSTSFTMDLTPGNYILALYGYGSSEGDVLQRGYFRYIGISNDGNNLNQNNNNNFRFNNVPGNLNTPINQ